MCCWAAKEWRAEFHKFRSRLRKEMWWVSIHLTKEFLLRVAWEPGTKVLILVLRWSHVSDTNGSSDWQRGKQMNERDGRTDRRIRLSLLISVALGFLLLPGWFVDLTKVGISRIWSGFAFLLPSPSMELSYLGLVLSPTLSVPIAFPLSNCVISYHHLKGTPAGRRQL